jgi:predicted membrane channel-forming protein YqfA (hemolysin III family)
MMSFIGMAMGISFAKWWRPLAFYIVYTAYIVVAMLVIWALQSTVGQQLEATAYLMIFGVVSATVSELLYCLFHQCDFRWNRQEPLEDGFVKSKFKRAVFTGRYIISAISLLSFSYTLWNADSHRWLCLPYSWFQLHAVWHLLTSIAALLSYYHFHQ